MKEVTHQSEKPSGVKVLPWSEFEYRLIVLHSLLECKIEDHTHMPIKFGSLRTESYAEIYQMLFEWSTPNKDDSIIGLIQENIKDEEVQDRMLSQFYSIREFLEIKIKQAWVESYV